MANLLSRLKAALHVFKNGFEYKDFPVAWPDFRSGQPQWRTADVGQFLTNGYSLNSLIYSAVMYKIRSTITAPLRAYRGNEYDPTPVEYDHPLAVRLRHPNPYQSFVELHARNTVFFNIAGEVFVYIDPVTGELYSFNPTRVRILPGKVGIQGYIYIPEGDTIDNGLPLLPENVLHIKLPNPLDPLEGLGYGMSPLQAAARIIDVDNTVTKFLYDFFRQGAMLTGVLKFDVPLRPNQLDAIRENWRHRYGGSSNWGVGIIDRGGDYKRVALTFEEMGFNGVDSRSETRILGPLGVPPILIGARAGLESSTYSNYEAARAAVWEDVLVPELTWFETEYQMVLRDGDAFVQYDYTRVPALQRTLARQVNTAFSLVQMRVPPNQALRAAGLRIGDLPNGDEPLILQGTGQNQGARVDAEEEGFGMRTESE